MESLEELKDRIESLRNLFADIETYSGDQDTPKDEPAISSTMSDEVKDSNPYR